MAQPLPSSMGEIMGSVVAGKWYVMAGLDAKAGKPMGVVYMYDPASDSWTAKKPMPVPAHHIMTAVFSNNIYVFGGFEGASGVAAWKPGNHSAVYDPATDAWKDLSPMPTPRGAGWAVELDGKIYVIGGAQANVRGNPAAPFTPGTPQLVLGTVEVYDPATDRWQTRAPMPTPRNHFVAAAVNGKIYAICGRLASAQIRSADDTNVVEAYDPASDQWSDQGRAPIRRSGMAGGTYNGKIYIAGGELQDWEGAKAFWAVESFDPVTGVWQSLPRDAACASRIRRWIHRQHSARRRRRDSSPMECRLSIRRRPCMRFCNWNAEI